jgi:hypothetical protein
MVFRVSSICGPGRAIRSAAVERRVKGGEIERQCRAGSRLDQLPQLVALTRLVFEKREDYELGCALLRVADRASNVILESRI